MHESGRCITVFQMIGLDVHQGIGLGFKIEMENMMVKTRQGPSSDPQQPIRSKEMDAQHVIGLFNPLQ